jgi:hypothetical protein
MSAVNVLLSWFRSSSNEVDLLSLRLEGIRGYSLDLSDPKVLVFARPKRAAAAPRNLGGNRVSALHG